MSLKKEFIGVRVDNEIFNSIVIYRKKTNLSITKIVENALINYFSEVSDKEINELMLEVAREKKREENKKKLRQLTLINNQLKLLDKLSKQLNPQELKVYYDALNDEAKLYGLTLEYDLKKYDIKIKGGLVND